MFCSLFFHYGTETAHCPAEVAGVGSHASSYTCVYARAHAYTPLLLPSSRQGWEKCVSTRRLGEACDVTGCCRGEGTKDGHLWPSHSKAWSEHPGCLASAREASCAGRGSSKADSSLPPLGWPSCQNTIPQLLLSILPALSKKRQVVSQLPRYSRKGSSEGEWGGRLSANSPAE